MSARGKAYVLASAIYAGTAGQLLVDIEDLEDRLYRAVDGIGLGTDEAKADLYAQLAERLTAETTFRNAIDIIEAAITSTQAALYGSH